MRRVQPCFTPQGEGVARSPCRGFPQRVKAHDARSFHPGQVHVRSFDLPGGYRTSQDARGTPYLDSAAAWLRARFPRRLNLTLGDSTREVPLAVGRVRVRLSGSGEGQLTLTRSLTSNPNPRLQP